MLARKRKPKLSHGLPEWGKDLPEDVSPIPNPPCITSSIPPRTNTSVGYLITQFFERLELFAFESMRRQEELTERIRKEVGLRRLAHSHAK